MSDLPIEYEAKFKITSKEDIRQKLRDSDATLVKPEFLQKRAIFHLPKGQEIEGGRLRVRDEDGKITMSLKVSGKKGIEDQKEVYLEVNDFNQAGLFLESIGCERKAYIETKRETWDLEDAEVVIDEWPFLEPYIEIEGASEQVVKQATEKLGFDYKDAIFGATDQLYSEKYGLSKDRINNETPEIVFESKNPFI
jgi:adenylate cyclase class 2